MARRGCRALVTIASAGWLGACQTAGPPPTPSAMLASERVEPAPPVDWASAPDCRAKLALLEQMARSGGLAAGERLPIVVILPGGSGIDDWLAPPSVTVAADLPLEVHQQSDLEQLDAPCVLMIEEPRDQRVDHRLMARDTIRSFYQSGTRSERNPDYDLAQLRVRQAEREARDDDTGILGVGDPMLDLIGTLINGVVSGFNRGRGEREVEEAMLELTNTPRSLDRPVYRAYEFEQMTVRAGKEATIPIALLDRTSGRVWRAELRQRERRELAVIDGLDPRDRDYEARRAASLTRHEFERWQREPPRLELTALAASLRAASPATAPSSPTLSAATVVSIPVRRPAPAGLEPHDLDAAIPLPPRRAQHPESVAWQPPAAAPESATAQSQARAAAVVAIHADRGSGSGVYVRRDLVLTTAALVGRASVVDVVAADGARVLGLVARTDPLRNLALIQVARPGAPAALQDGPPVATGQAVEGVLHGAAGGTRSIPGRYLGSVAPAGTLAGSFAGLVYVDSPAAPERPEATPWFLGDALVALGTGAAVDEAGGARGAIAAAAMLDFLYGTGGALAALP